VHAPFLLLQVHLLQLILVQLVQLRQGWKVDAAGLNVPGGQAVQVVPPNPTAHSEQLAAFLDALVLVVKPAWAKPQVRQCTIQLIEYTLSVALAMPVHHCSGISGSSSTQPSTAKSSEQELLAESDLLIC
jgi:hypothetical protein